MTEVLTPETVVPPAGTMESPEPVKTKKKRNILGYDGKAGKLFGLTMINVFLSFLTLGIYSFWGKTRIRRYLISSMMINGKERFEYTGTAKELLVGWCKAMVVFGPVLVVLIWSGKDEEHPFIYLLSLAAFYILFYAGIYLALRYRLSRTKWRGIRFGLAGSAMTYLKICVKRLFFNVVTLGYGIAKSDIEKWTYMAGEMRFGRLKFKYRGDYKKLTWINMITLWLPLIPIASLATLLGALSEPGAGGETPVPPVEPDATKLAFIVILMVIFVIIGVLGRLWYRAALRAEKFNGLSLEGIRFKSTATGKDYLKLKLMNLLIMIGTLGYGFAIVISRNMAFECKHTIIGGDLDLLMAAQAEANSKSDVGDALAPDLDLGAALAIGI